MQHLWRDMGLVDDTAQLTVMPISEYAELWKKAFPASEKELKSV